MPSMSVSPVGGLAFAGTAPVSFTSGGSTAQVASDIVVEWDFDNDGDFDQPAENITSHVLAAETLTGRDFPSNLHGLAGAGQLRLSLLNNDDRFSYFNTSSPLTAAPNSLRVGRKIRVRTVEATAVDPTLLARDRFNKTGPLAGTADELGNVWAPPLSPFASMYADGQVARAITHDGAFCGNNLNLGTPTVYVQARIDSRVLGAGRAGIFARWDGLAGSNIIYAWLSSTHFIIFDQTITANIGTPYPVSPEAGMTFGIRLDGTAVTGILNGAPVITGTTALTTGNFHGIWSEWPTTIVEPPTLADFYVWDRPQLSVPGVLWTGDVTDVSTVTPVDGLKVAQVEASGTLARAAAADVRSPRAPAGGKTGVLVGQMMAAANLLTPPGDSINTGTVTTGPVGINDGKALDLARQFEATEFGFIYEQPEGPPGFQDRAARALASLKAWFTDTPGLGQYPYSSIVPLDYKREVVNRVTAGVAPSAPAGITRTYRSTATVTGVANNVSVLMPSAVNPGDLLITIMASTVLVVTQDWNEVPLWTTHRHIDWNPGVRVYSRHCDGTEGGTTVQFYTDSGPAGGAWIAHIIRVEDWFENTQGIVVVEPVSGTNPPSLEAPWGRDATLWIAARGAFASATGMSVSGAFPPAGYEGTLDSSVTNGGTDVADVGLQTAWKIDTSGAEQPSTFGGIVAATLSDATLIAVRGFNGPFTRGTLTNPKISGGEGRFVTINDLGSQAEHNAVLSYRDPGNLFAGESDATVFADAVIARHGDDRPIFSLGFWASSSAALREQAYSRRVGDKITVTASGDTGLGVQGQFFIESIGHTWSKAGKVWQVVWQLSPA